MSTPIRRNLFIGRYSPFHKGHKYIIDQALENGESVAIAVRERPLTEGDPYSVPERIAMIEKTYKEEVKDGRVLVFPICDISAVSIGRKVGYAVNRYDAPEHITGISATDIRNKMNGGDDSWKENVAEGTKEWFEEQPKGRVIWLTGPSGAGKTTIAQELSKRMSLRNSVKILDGDELRTGISSNLGLSPQDRKEHNRRVAYLAKVIADVQGVAIVALISPYEKNRSVAEGVIGKNRFQLVYVKSTQEDRIERDPKGLYQKAIKGEIQNLTGYDGEYEEPISLENPIVVDTSHHSVEECVDKILENLID